MVRSPSSPSSFLETMVYSDRGGLQCPEPLLPVRVFVCERGSWLTFGTEGFDVGRRRDCFPSATPPPKKRVVEKGRE